MGLDVLVLLKEGPARAADIAAAQRINRAAVYRLLHTLEAHRFVERTGNEGRYRLTVVVWKLGTAALTTSDVRALARQHIGWLSDVLGETVHLAIYDAGEVVYIATTRRHNAQLRSLATGTPFRRDHHRRGFTSDRRMERRWPRF